jgi:hypothetical protein
VTGWIVVIAFLLTPLACWALLARTKILGWTFAAVFAAYAVTEFCLAPGWLFSDRLGGERLWLILGLPAMSVVALVAGTQLENRDLAVPRMRSTRRGSAGVILSSLYALGVAGLLILTALVAPALDLSSGPAMPRPPSSSVLPLGPGLAVQQDLLGCGTAKCTTFFYVSYGGRSGNEVLQQVVNQLNRLHGWGLAASSGLSGCRYLGGQDGAQDLCVTVTDAPASKIVMIELDTESQLDG